MPRMTDERLAEIRAEVESKFYCGSATFVKELLAEIDALREESAQLKREQWLGKDYDKPVEHTTDGTNGSVVYLAAKNHCAACGRGSDEPCDCG